MNWQPIETAPKDGSIILLYRPTAAKWAVIAPGAWNDDHYAKHPRPYWEGWLKIGSVSEYRYWTPTHWMPLPEPPK